MSLSDRILTGRRPAPRRTLLYGPHGIGKSTFGAMAPTPVFVPTEDGLGQIDCHRFPLAGRFDDVMTALAELHHDQHAYRTVVIDTLDWLERLVHAEVCRDKKVEHIEDIGYARGYAYALVYWRKFLERLDELRSARSLGVVLLAHAKVERYESPETDSYDRYVPRLHKTCSYLAQEWCDEVLFATYRVQTRLSDEGFQRRKARGLGTGERIVKTTERPTHLAKNRLNLPDELPLDYRAYAQFFSTEVS